MKIFITGVSSGIGRALTEKLVRSGHEVWGIARRGELLDKLKKELGAEKLHLSVCDLEVNSDMETLAEHYKNEGFLPDCVILNAGVYLEDLQGFFDYHKFERAMKVNVNGVLFWVNLFLPEFLKRRSGAFIGISSTSAFRPNRKDLSYSASKAAISMSMRGLRLNFSGSGVRFLNMYFGPLNTTMWQGSRSRLVPSAEQAADYLIHLLEKPSGSYFYPIFTTMLFRLSRLFPDWFFTFVSRAVFKRFGG